jgi:hypothetical protein
MNAVGGLILVDNGRKGHLEIGSFAKSITHEFNGR